MLEFHFIDLYHVLEHNSDSLIQKDIFFNLSKSFKENEKNFKIEEFTEIIIFGGTFKKIKIRRPM